MKTVRKINVLVIVIASVIALAGITSVTWAWVAMNRQVESKGVSMTIESSPNLVISDSASTIATYTESSWTNSYITKTWSESTTELIPADHYDSTTYPTVAGSNNVNLVYNSNPENVVRNTGKGTSLTFTHVPSDGEDEYFIDRTVYIASLGSAMTRGTDYSNLVFTITETGSGTTTNRAYKSASVDVYVAGAYKGTLNLDTLNSITVSDVTTIPLNTSSSIEITFRCYFDGALQDANDASKNYVNSTSLATNTANITFDITITAAAIS